MSLRRRLALIGVGAVLGLAAGGLVPLPKPLLPQSSEPAGQVCACPHGRALQADFRAI